MPRLFANLRYKLVALGLALLLWFAAHGSKSIERPFDIPVVFQGIPEELVVTSRSADALNLRVTGTRAALRNLPGSLEYVVDVSGARPGGFEHEVDATRLDLPRGAEIASRSPSEIEVRFEARATRAVRVRPDIEGEPAVGFHIAAVGIEPARVQITGARSEVLRISEVVTETIDVSDASESMERQVRVLPGGSHVWMKDATPVRVRVQVEPEDIEASEAGSSASREEG